MRALRVALDDALAGHGRLVFLVGDPGIGKTRTAVELAATARRRRACVLWGHCDEGSGAPAFWPWVQVISAARRDLPEDALVHLRACAADIAVAVAEVRPLVADLAAAPPADPEAARVRFFEAMTQFLTRAAGQQPLVVVLDDLQWADRGSLALLRSLAGELQASQLLILGAYRDVEVGRGHPLSRVFAQLTDQGMAQRIGLAGLHESEVAGYIRRVTASEPPASLVSAVWRESEGNPLFIREVLSLLADQGRLQHPAAVASWSLAIPQGVRAVIGSRLNRLSLECNQVLALAAVVGQHFGLGILQAMVKHDEAPAGSRLPALLDEAEDGRLIEVVPGVDGQYRFTHALIRETLYEELGTQRRVHLHRQVMAAMEQVFAADIQAHLSPLAHHALHGAYGDGDVDKAIDYALRAAREATAHLAHEAAVSHYEEALQALALKETADPVSHCDLLLALGAAHSRAGDVRRARASVLEAVSVARRCGDPRHLAEAAVGLWNIGMGWHKPGELDDEALAVLDRALAGLGSADTVLRARVLTYRAQVLNRSMLPDLIEQAKPLSEEALGVARRTGDRDTLLEALSLRYWVLETPENHPERQSVLEEFVPLAATCADPGPLMGAYQCRINRNLEVGDRATAESDIEAVGQLAEQFPRPLFRVVVLGHRALLAQAAGRFEEEERAAEQLFTLGQGAVGPVSTFMYSTHVMMVRREQGRIGEIEMGARAGVAQFPGIPSYRVAVAWICAEAGQIDTAREEFERLAATDFTVTWDVSWLWNHAMLAMTCAILNDTSRAAILYDRLRPYADLCVWTGGPIWMGSVALFVGLLARTLSRWDEAEQHFRHALDVNARIAHRPYLAHTQYEYAVSLLARGRSSERDAAFRLLTRALETARELGMIALLERGLALERQCVPEAAQPNAGAQPRALRPDAEEAAGAGTPASVGTRDALFRHEGEYWTLGYEGAMLRFKDSKGLQYIAYLLRHPGEEFHALDLTLRVAGNGEVAQPGALDAADGGLVLLDAQAKAEYKRRLVDLQDELEEAERIHDLGRAARARDEIDSITEQLAAAVGLRGRDRPVGAAAERARLAVTKRIKDAIRRIEASDARLGRLLAQSIRTGTFCAYVPDPERPIAWTV